MHMYILHSFRKLIINPIIDYIEKNPNKAPRLFYAGPLIDGKHNVYKGEIDGYPELSISLDESTNTENQVKNISFKED